MSEMIERAAKAIEQAEKQEQRTIGGPRYYVPHARAALSAALDPKDSNLAEVAGRGMLACAASVGSTHGNWDELGPEAQATYVMLGQAAIAALKAAADSE